MKVFLILICLLFCLPVFANRKAIGISLGNPTGLNGKYWLNDNAAVDAGLGLSFGKHTDFSLHSDYLLHKESAFYFNDVHPLDLYYGIGGRMEFADDIEIGIRFPLGLVHFMEDKSSEFFSEIAPVVDVLTKTGIEFHFLLGARYYY